METVPYYIVDFTAIAKRSEWRQTFELDSWNTRSPADEWVLFEQQSLLSDAFLMITNSSLQSKWGH